MAAQDIAQSLQRIEAVLRRRPESGLHDDAPATARWDGGTRIVASHPGGKQVVTDMPGEMGGSGDQVTPGWLFRAGLASCTATCIAMAAAARGIELQTLELRASSRSDTRGMLGLPDADGREVSAAPQDVQLHVRIAARGVASERLHALVEDSYRCSPVPRAVKDAVPVAVRIEVIDLPGSPASALAAASS
jgi:uncharacterized OsmC-like protein